MPTIDTAKHQRKSSVIGSIVRMDFPRPPSQLVGDLSRYDVTAISELVGPMYTMDGAVRSLYEPAVPVCGAASTVKCPPGDNLAMVKALTLVEPGDVLVVDAKGFSEWCLGGFQLLKFARDSRGLAGLIVNGAYRDVREAQEAGFPVYATGVAPYSGPKIGPGEINVAVCCGGVVVHPGDVVSASEEGIVVVPQDYLGVVAKRLADTANSARYVREGSHIVESDTHIEEVVRMLSSHFNETLYREEPAR